MKTKLIYISMMLFALSAHGEQATSDLAPSVYGNQVVNQPANIPDPNDPSNRYNEYNGRGSGFVNTIKDKSPTATAKAPEQTSINPGAQVGQNSQSSGAGLNAAVGAALIGACLAPCPKCMMPLCAMGAMALMQAGHDAGAAGQSAASFDASKYGANPTVSDPNGIGGFDKDKLALATAKLGEAGYTVSENGVKYPDGSTYGSTDLISPAAMESAGLGAGSAAEAQSLVDGIVADATKDANSPRVSGVGINGGGGGSGGSGGDGGGSSSAYGSGTYAMNADDQKKLIAGKTVMFDGEPIGVRGNNIFEMVHQAYQKKRQGNQFIETADNSGASIRAPASLPSLKPLGK